MPPFALNTHTHMRTHPLAKALEFGPPQRPLPHSTRPSRAPPALTLQVDEVVSQAAPHCLGVAASRARVGGGAAARQHPARAAFAVVTCYLAVFCFERAVSAARARARRSNGPHHAAPVVHARPRGCVDTAHTRHSIASAPACRTRGVVQHPLLEAAVGLSMRPKWASCTAGASHTHARTCASTRQGAVCVNGRRALPCAP
jgi:hypothetical protein